jgi:hypothetical protein
MIETYMAVKNVREFGAVAGLKVCSYSRLLLLLFCCCLVASIIWNHMRSFRPHLHRLCQGLVSEASPEFSILLFPRLLLLLPQSFRAKP